jgi:Ran GTPase-activating protein (RanGAP) involved in mRNA processing and transport
LPWDQLVDYEEPIVWHEPTLDEYWAEFYDQMKQLDSVPDILDIHNSNVEKKKECLAALVAIFRSGRAANLSKMITFRNTNLCGNCIAHLTKLVEASSMLYILLLDHNRIDNMESARCLSRSLRSHACIRRLCLNHCDLGSSPEILLVILQSDVKGIDLSNNNIDSLGAVKIAEYLESNPPIRGINLDHNRLNDDDAVLISKALKRNTNLKTIHLRPNHFTSIGVKALLTCVFDRSSLNAISESNHILVRMNVFTYSRDDSWLQDCIDRLLALNRTQKILLALQDKDCLLQCLANVPVELIPKVLVFPRQRVEDQCQHEYFSVVYSTMRWWNMPMLYSYSCCVKSDAKEKRQLDVCMS